MIFRRGFTGRHRRRWFAPPSPPPPVIAAVGARWNVEQGFADDFRQMLFDHLDPANRERLRREESIIIVGSNGGVYEIHYGSIQNVRALWRGQLVKLCAQVPLGYANVAAQNWSTMLAQVLAITTNELLFLETVRFYVG